MNPAWMWTVGLVVIHGQFTLNQTTCVKNVLATFGVDFLGQTKTCMNEWHNKKMSPWGIKSSSMNQKHLCCSPKESGDPTDCVPFLVWQFSILKFTLEKKQPVVSYRLKSMVYFKLIWTSHVMDRPPADPQRSKYFLQRLRGPPGPWPELTAGT